MVTRKETLFFDPGSGSKEDIVPSGVEQYGTVEDPFTVTSGIGRLESSLVASLSL